MSKTYYVKIPFAGYVGLEVEADDEESAIEAALDKAAMTCEAEAECQGDEDGDVHPQEG
jgi:hypothetical protein